jgi:predicted nucleotidyltransferase
MTIASGSTAAATAIELPREAIEGFCRRWRITELELFGSILRDDFGPESDVDFLVTFAPDARWTLFDLVDTEEELGRLVGRRVDLVTRRAVEESENWIRRSAILEGAQPYYVER